MHSLAIKIGMQRLTLGAVQRRLHHSASAATLCKFGHDLGHSQDLSLVHL